MQKNEESPHTKVKEYQSLAEERGFTERSLKLLLKKIIHDEYQNEALKSGTGTSSIEKPDSQIMESEEINDYCQDPT